MRFLAGVRPICPLGASPRLANALEERVAEDAVPLRGRVEVTDPRIECCGFSEAGADRGLANPLDHRREGLSREAVDEARPARVHVYHARRNLNCGEARLHHQWVELPPDQCVATGPPLQLDLALDRGVSGGAVGMEVRRSVISL